MSSDKYKKVDLNKNTHSVRASQAVLQYGVGAMVDFRDQTLMTAAPEYWATQVIKIHDERLERALHVHYFGMPFGQNEKGISYVRFPEWYFCPKCRRFQPLSKWVKEYRLHASKKYTQDEPDMVKHMKCPMCKQELNVARIIVACPNGHIDDFPWVKWVHCQNTNGGPKKVCDNPSLTIKTAASSSEGLESIVITCEHCGAKATLRGAFAPGKFQKLDEEHNGSYNFKCEGRHPWKHSKESCSEYPTVLQRGSSSVYFPITKSSLVIPPYSSSLTKRIEGSVEFGNTRNTIVMLKEANSLTSENLINIISTAARKIASEIGDKESQIQEILKRKWMEENSKENEDAGSIKYKAEEYYVLNGDVNIGFDKFGDFNREGTNIEDYNEVPYIKKISLIRKIREVQALVGFSRLKPVEGIGSDNANSGVVSIKENKTDWYPAYEVRGEGIFIEFDQAAIADWENANPEILERVNVIIKNYKKSFLGSMHERKISAKFLLLHTISHLLIKQLSFECGYSVASIKERLYCGDLENGKEMSGILIYTASGDSEGTLGGLVRQGYPDVFPTIYRKAIETALTCSNDPICSLSQGQGRDSLNLSACYACSLIPETSCEEFNAFLDRAMVVGTCEKTDIGFYSKWLKGEQVSAKKTLHAESEDKDLSTPIVIVSEIGTDMSELSYEFIWKSVGCWSDGEEKKRIEELALNAGAFAVKEKPFNNSKLRVTGYENDINCDLFWKESRVAFFTEDHFKDYEVANKSDIKCFLITNCDCTPIMIADALKER